MYDLKRLARAVIHQWIIDGKPKSGVDGIRIYAEIIEMETVNNAVKQAHLMGVSPRRRLETPRKDRERV
jgi:hypothetical protein